jgi:putative transcription factor
MDCDICGKKEAIFYIEIEGAKMSACPGCAHGAKIIGKMGSAIDESTKAETPVIEYREKETEIDENCGKIMRETREEKKLELVDLARSINENENYLKHIEQGKLMPTLKTARKLEKALGIRLISEVSRTVSESGTMTKREEFRLEDLAEKGER